MTQSMTVQDRLTILANQQSVSGDDEIRWRLGRFRPSFATGITVLDPLLALEWMKQLNVPAVQQWLAQAPATQCIAKCCGEMM